LDANQRTSSISVRNLNTHTTTEELWNVAPCSLVEVLRRFGVTYCLYLQSLAYSSTCNMETVSSSVPKYIESHSRK
jgi:hypothetical protein